MDKRDYAFDNIKFFLIVLVVFAHLLEIAKGYSTTSDLYRIIYSFHMPLFIFITGYFARFSKRRVVNMILIYIAFQHLYILYINEKFGYNNIIQFTTPYWLLWYLLVYIFYLFLIPLLDFEKYDLKNSIKAILVIFVSIGIYFIMPRDKTQGYYLTVSRFITFLPYFIMGFYARNIIKANPIKLKKWQDIVLRMFFLVIAFVALCIIFNKKEISSNMLYGSYSYEYGKYTAKIKLILMFCALAWIGFFTITLRFNKKIPFLTRLGKNTFTVFLFHGFFVKYFLFENTLWKEEYSRMHILLLSVWIVVVLGNIVMEYFAKYILYGEAIDVSISFSKKMYAKLKDRKKLTIDENKDNNIDINVSEIKRME